MVRSGRSNTGGTHGGSAPSRFHGFVGASPAMRRLYRRIEQFATAHIPVLILGESGTGKDLAARAIWRISDPEQPFVVANCAAIPASLMESELFGHARGAFTGATRRHTGILARADGGVLFLDEVAELPRHVQAKLLRAIESGEYRPVGGEAMQRSRFRVIAATNRDLEALAARGEFREDLLHRLGAARLILPALRDRREDIPALVQAFAAGARKGVGRAPRFTARAMELLRRHEWPGNVRQLRNVVEAVAAIAPRGTVDAEHVAEFLGVPSDSSENHGLPSLTETVREAERQAIREALIRAGGNRELAAELLDVSPATLYRRLAELDPLEPDDSQN